MSSRSGHHGRRKPRLGQILVIIGRVALLALFAGIWVTGSAPGHPVAEIVAAGVLVLGWLVIVAQAMLGGDRARA